MLRAMKKALAISYADLCNVSLALRPSCGVLSLALRAEF